VWGVEAGRQACRCILDFVLTLCACMHAAMYASKQQQVSAVLPGEAREGPFDAREGPFDARQPAPPACFLVYYLYITELF